MNAAVLIAGVVAAIAVAALLAWVFLRPAKPTKPVKAVAPPPAAKAIAAPKKTVAKAPTATAPSVAVPNDTSSTRWVGALIDKHPDEAAAVLKRWIKDK